MIYKIKRLSSWVKLFLENAKIVPGNIGQIKKISAIQNLSIVLRAENIIKIVKYVEKKYLYRLKHVLKNVHMN